MTDATSLDYKFNYSATLNVDILTNYLIVARPPALVRISVNLATSGIFSLRRKSSGTTITEKFNSGVALTAGTTYLFDVLVDGGQTFNFQTDTTGTVNHLIILEMGGDM